MKSKKKIKAIKEKVSRPWPIRFPSDKPDRLALRLINQKLKSQLKYSVSRRDNVKLCVVHFAYDEVDELTKLLDKVSSEDK